MSNIKNIACRVAGIAGLMLLCTSLSGCAVTSGAAFGAASGAMAAKGVGNDFKYYVFDVPPQVVYRIDDHRFFTLENYKDCEHGGIVYYHDTNKNIKQYITGRSDSNAILIPNPMMSWKGQFIYAASDNVIASITRYPLMSDRDTHSGVYLVYRIEGRVEQIKVAGDTDPGFDKMLIITNDNLYVKATGLRGRVYELLSLSGNKSVGDARIVENKDWPKISSPSGEQHLTCDILIKPNGVTITSKQVYDSDATGIPKHEQ